MVRCESRVCGMSLEPWGASLLTMTNDIPTSYSPCMSIPFLDLQAQYRAIKQEIDPAIQGVIDAHAFAGGPAVDRFEQEFAAFSGVAHCVGVNSGTAALQLLLQAHGIGPGDEVITVANTFFATAEAIILSGATPVLVDCDERTALIDVRQVEAAITQRTKAVIPVHLYGQPAPMEELASLAKKHGLLLFEDACQAHGAKLHGQTAGGMADGAVFSFYPGKNLGAYGEAGAVATNDAGIAGNIRMLRDHGQPAKYVHRLIGMNERMDGIQGAVLSVKLKHLPTWNEARRNNAALYRKYLPTNIQLFEELPGAQGVYHLFVVRVPDRDAVQKKLQERGIQTGIHYPIPIHLQEAVTSYGWKKGQFPVSEKLAEEILSLPMFPELTEAQIEEVCAMLAASL